MDIDIIELSERKGRFVLSGVSASFANALRRSMLAEVPVLAIDEVNVYDNTSILFDEQLALRLGLIPLKSDNSYTMPEECSCEGEGCASCQVSLTLSAEGPRMVYSGDLVSTDPKVCPADPTIPIVELKENHKIVVEAIARLGIGKKHAKWQAGIACGYKNLPVITIDECDLCEKCVEACPRNILKINGNKLHVVNIMDCSLCKLCEEACDTESIKVKEDPECFIMSFETSGAMTAAQLVEEAINNIKKKAIQLNKILEEL